MAWLRSLPVINNNSRALSMQAVSLAPGVIMGGILAMSAPNIGDSNWVSLACIQLMLPLRVLISPLWARYRYG